MSTTSVNGQIATASAEARQVLIETRNVRIGYQRRHTTWVVDNVTINIYRGEALALIGESGSGKSTLARAILGLARASEGELLFGDRSISMSVSGRRRGIYPGAIQMVFQDSSTSLDPHRRIGDSIIEPLRVNKRMSAGDATKRVEELLAEVGLPSELAGRRPRQLSGGQRQRVNIARALAPEPELVILDEAVSALDVSVQAGVLNLLRRLKREREITYLLISHDMVVAARISDRLAVMYLGRIVEVGPTRECVARPMHPYTQLLLSAVPSAESEDASRAAPGEAPDLRHVPSGCRFRTRCPHAQARCEEEVPELRTMPSGVSVACHFAEQINASHTATSY